MSVTGPVAFVVELVIVCLVGPVGVVPLDQAPAAKGWRALPLTRGRSLTLTRMAWGRRRGTRKGTSITYGPARCAARSRFKRPGSWASRSS